MDIKDLQRQLERELKDALSRAITKGSEMVVNQSQENIINEEFNGVPYTEVQRRTPGTNAYKYPKKKDLGRRSRGILRGKGSGRLVRSIRTKRSTRNGFVVGEDTTYGQYHNRGTKDIPKRQFLGLTKSLEDDLEAVLTEETNKVKIDR